MKKATLIKLLIALGISKANAEQIASTAPDDGNDVIDETAQTALLDEWKASQVELFKNDKKLVDEIRSSEAGKQKDIFERKLKQTFGLTPEDIKDKTTEEIIAIAKTKSSTAPADIKKLEEENLSLTNQIKALNEVEIPKIRGEVAQKQKAIDIERYLKTLIPTNPEDLRLPAETAFRLVNMDISERFDVDFDDKGKAIFKQKGSDLRAKTEDGSKFIEAEDFFKERLEHHGAIKKSNGGDPPPNPDPVKVTKKKGDDEAEGNTLHLAAAEAHLKELQGK